ncbi:hypothetical protein LXA47_12475 [Massilia sp. P8910]|uniref:hypothetical protein n=1 Tax=Massilia antarctica TaxID=2765360 RepID=UPI001E4BE798|nr:hypothetical protein [Massilia antarctica]MCE3604418.1 hypothetical protein [Massilia antarctica]
MQSLPHMTLRARRTACAFGLGIHLFLAAGASAQQLPPGFFPESLAIAADGTLFTGSATESSIVRVRPGARGAEPFVAAGTGGLMSVQGLLADDAAGRLYACSADLGVARTPKMPSALLAFDLSKGTLLGRWPLPGDGFCNDLARAPDGRLYISDSAQPRILRFDPARSTLISWITHPLLGGARFNGNGVALDGGQLYLSTFSDGRLLRVPLHADGGAGTPVVVPLPRPLAGGDALRTLSPGILLAFENDIDGGNGRVTMVDLRGPQPSLTTFAEGLAEPVSGVVRGGYLIVVESQFGVLFGKRRGQASGPFALRRIALPTIPAAAGSAMTP